MEKITITEAHQWVCLCGNTAEQDGFFPSLEDGTRVEPFSGEKNPMWEEKLKVCGRCGRVINLETLEVVATKVHLDAKLYTQESYRAFQSTQDRSLLVEVLAPESGKLYVKAWEGGGAESWQHTTVPVQPN